MIRKSIEVGTRVFSEVYGFGIFKGWTDYGDSIVQFSDSLTKSIARKYLSEIVDNFDPPI